MYVLVHACPLYGVATSIMTACKGQPHLKDARKVVESVMEGWRRLHDGRVALLFEVGHHDVVVGLPELCHLKSRTLVIDTNKILTSVVAKKN